MVLDLGCGTVSPPTCESYKMGHCKLSCNRHAACSLQLICQIVKEANGMQGRLAIGAALLGSPHVIGIDIDSSALETCSQNMDQFEELPVS